MKEKEKENTHDEDATIEYEDSFPDAEEIGKNPQDIIKRLKQNLAECRKEKEEYLAGWQRSRADFVNAKRAHEKEKEETVAFAKESFIFEIIPTLDHFDMAFKDKSWSELSHNWRVGIENIYKELWKTLESLGLQKFDDLGKIFDPERHFSAGVVPVKDPSQDGIIQEIFQPGYILLGRIIRPARVRVGEIEK